MITRPRSKPNKHKSMTLNDSSFDIFDMAELLELVLYTGSSIHLLHVTRSMPSLSSDTIQCSGLGTLEDWLLVWTSLRSTMLRVRGGHFVGWHFVGAIVLSLKSRHVSCLETCNLRPFPRALNRWLSCMCLWLWSLPRLLKIVPEIATFSRLGPP